MFPFVTSCLPETPEPPYGVWVSENPRIVMYFKPEYQISMYPPIYIGSYILDDVETKVFANFGSGLRFGIYPLSSFIEGSGGVTRGGSLLIGSYRVIRGEIHYTLTPPFQEELGVRTIIFRRVEDYRPIDPYDWFPNFFSRSEE
ncbi:MAG: hypothetical protein FWE05_12635 [Defluviitaleaceae bacterium]|nr:hypothetical protein [Defluviitaleaceae bacterium]